MTTSREQYHAALLETLGDEEGSSFHFCWSGAEAINGALFAHYFEGVRHSGQNQILTVQTESAPILFSLQRLEELGCATKLLRVNKQGQITKEMLLEGMNPRTSLFSISWAQGLTGVIHPIADLAEVCREKKIALHVDATHVLGKLYFRLEDLAIDYFTFDGKGVGAPFASAGLVVKKKTAFSPFVVGNEEVPLSSLADLTHALIENARTSDHLCLEIARLRDKLEREIKRALTDSVLFFEEVERLPHCAAIGFPGVSGEALLYLLQQKNSCQVEASVGGGTIQRLSHLLITIGIDSLLAESAISFSLSHKTTEEEVDCAIDTIIHSVKRLKSCCSDLFGGCR